METFNDIITSDQPTLVDFYATWCGPCRTMHPILEQIKNTMGNRIRILKIDIDRNNATATTFHIQSVPTLILFRNGKILWRQSGAIPQNELLTILDSYLIK